MRRATLLMLLVALAQAKLRLSGRQARGSLSAIRDEADNSLVDSLRRQLMHDNYDYMSSANDDLLAPAPQPQPYDGSAPTHAGHPVDDGDYFPEHAPARLRSDLYRPHRSRPRVQSRRVLRQRERLSLENGPRAPARKVPYQRVESNVPVSNKDLYYYMDDAHLDAGDALAFNALDVADAPDDDDDFADDAPPSTRKKKYTMLELEGGGGARRSAAGGRRRFVQEEGDDGIAIVSLDNGPFPEFRLPTDRRQYMHHDYDHHDAPPEAPAHHPRAPPPQFLEHSLQEDELLYLT